jgi:hypothetical protein
MCRRVALRSSLRITLVLLIGVALLPAMRFDARERDGPEPGSWSEDCAAATG